MLSNSTSAARSLRPSPFGSSVVWIGGPQSDRPAVESMLGGLGLQLRWATGVPQALGELREHPATLCLLDCTRGGEALRIARNIRTERPRAVLIGVVDPQRPETSLEALAWLPSLSLRRCRNIRLRLPSGRIRGRKKQLSPPGAWASTRKTSDIGAEVNHLWPRKQYVPSPFGVACVVPARTSEPPCFSVIDMPAVMPGFVLGTFRSGSYSRLVSSGS